MQKHYFVGVCVWCLCLNSVNSEFLLGAGAVVSTVIAGFMGGLGIYCNFRECCDDRWISTNFTDLAVALNERLFGQHLVVNTVVKHLKAHARGESSKALALSFHGWTGTGKNYVSKIIADTMFKEGMKSQYVHLISATKEFPHKEMINLYKDVLKDRVETAVKKCGQSLFIFDEMDKMHAGLIDTVKPYLDFYDNLGGVDYKRAIFLFLSNTAGNDIAELTVKEWTNGGDRQKLTLKAMENVIRLPVLNTENSGLWHSELITKNLITAFVPFLPLERKHVKQCIRYALIEKKYYKHYDEISEGKVQEIADELPYYPEGVGVFSAKGCKAVHEKMNFIMEEV